MPELGHGFENVEKWDGVGRIDGTLDKEGDRCNKLMVSHLSDLYIDTISIVCIMLCQINVQVE